jgi:hypothetical protein
MKKKLQIFVSSTYTDLIEERQAAVSAILKAGHIPAGMELFTSGDESQMETIKRWIDESDVFMLVLGGRYGSIEPTTSLSYMELEYDYAVNSGMPFFAVVIDDAALEQKVRLHGRQVIENEYTQELKAFRNKVLNKMSAFYRDVRDIRLTVHETISDFLVRYNFKGWVSGSDVPDISTFTEQINRLREENERLVKDNASLKQQLTTSQQSLEAKTPYNDLVKILDAIEIKIDVKELFAGYENQVSEYLQEQGDEEQYLSLCTLLKLSRVAEQLIIGVYNRYNMENWEKFLFFNVMPKLQLYGLAASESVPGVAYRRYALSPKGIGFLQYLREQHP